MILFGDFPDEQRLLNFRQEMSGSYALPNYVNDLICALPANSHPMEVIQSMLAIVGKYKPSQIKTRRVSDANEKKRAVVIGLDEQARELIRILAQIPTIVANFYRAQQDLELLKPRPDLSLLGNFLYLFSGKEPSAEDTRIFEICQMLQMEHGLNASTFTARVVASTLAPVHACLSSAVGALFGPLHGGADEAAFRMARDLIGHPDLAEQFVTKTLNEGGKIMGLGHRVYKTVDPRAVILRRLSAQLNAEKGMRRTAFSKLWKGSMRSPRESFQNKGKRSTRTLNFTRDLFLMRSIYRLCTSPACLLSLARLDGPRTFWNFGRIIDSTVLRRSSLDNLEDGSLIIISCFTLHQAGLIPVSMSRS